MMAHKMPGSRGAIIAATAADSRDTVVEGHSGILNVCPPWDRPTYQPTKRLVLWENGSRATLFSADEPDRLRGPQFHWAICDELCLVADTLITTSLGEVPISNVKSGDFVMTRSGMRRVKRAWKTLDSADVYELVTSSGKRLIGTKNHPIWTQNRGFTSLIELRSGDKLIESEVSCKALYGTAEDTGLTADITWIEAQDCCTGRYTQNTTAKSQKDSTYTTRTGIKRITPSKTLRRLPDRNILKDIDQKAGNRGINQLNPLLNGQKIGSHTCANAIIAARSMKQQEREVDFVATTVSKPIADTIRHNAELSHVFNAGSHLLRTPAAKDSARNIALQPTVKKLYQRSALYAGTISKSRIQEQSAAQSNVAIFTESSVVTVTKLPYKAAVYNLEVDDCHEYFANGVLTHNSSWRYPSAWDMLEFGLRLGKNPQVVVATTPKPVSHLRRLVADSENPDQKITVTTGSMYENIDNLAPTFISAILRKYEGTRLGEQEIHAVLHEDAKYSLWKSDMFEREYFRFTDIPDLIRVVVAVDPAIKSESDRRDDELDDKLTETGIIVIGSDRRGHGYVLEDATIAGSPKEWADEVVRVYKKYAADRVVVEINNGGEMVAYTIRTSDPNIAISEVSASRAKQTRAEPIVALYEQGRMHHRGVLADLETQMVQWEPGAKSPDRMDALVWGASFLFINDKEEELMMRQGGYNYGNK